MKEIPTPTLPLLSLLDFRRAPVAPAPAVAPHGRTAGTPAIEVVWARQQSDVRAAQQLRWAVFAEEMGARLPQQVGELAGHDIDAFDDHCEHLLVRTLPTPDQPAMVVGTYRVLTPGGARRAGGLYSDTEFDLGAWRAERSRLAELGRSCVHPDHRHGGVILALWGALASFMESNGLHTMLGCASVSMRDGGHQAASLWARLQKDHLAPASLRVSPRLALPVDELDQSLTVEPPALIKGYLRCGAKLLGAPAWDPDFNTADLPMALSLADLPARYRRHFTGTL